jgi:hypothetical protein
VRHHGLTRFVPLAICTLLASVTTAGLLALPASAVADGDITILSVSSPADNAGLMTVQTQSGTPITSLSVTLLDNGQSAGPSPVTDFSLIGQTGTDPVQEIWQVENPVTASELDPGTYATSVDATDTAGPETGLNGGNFPFLILPAVTLTASPTSIDYSSQAVTFSGQATDIPPGDTVAQDYAGQPVVVYGPPTSANPGGQQYDVTTDSSGDYSFTIATAPTGEYYAQIAATATASPATSADVTVTAAPDPVQLAAAFTRSAIDYGQADELTGTATYTASGGATKPLANVTVTIARPAPPGQGELHAVTDAAGHFSAPIPRQTVTGNWTVTAGGGSLLQQAQQDLTLTVRQETAFRHVSIVLGAFKTLTVRACLIVSSQGSPGQPVIAPVALQYARRAKGTPWRTLTTIRPVSGVSYCPNGSPVWQATVKAPAASAYYRLEFAGTQSLEADNTRPVDRWRDLTRITSYTVTPRRVAANGAITISGRLWRRTTSWQPEANRRVAIQFRYLGVWYQFQFEPRTNSRGYFRGRFTVYVTSTWIAKFFGDKTHFGCVTSGVKVTVTSHKSSSRAAAIGRGVERVS